MKSKKNNNNNTNVTIITPKSMKEVVKDALYESLLKEHIVNLEDKLPSIINPDNPADFLGLYEWIKSIPRELILNSFSSSVQNIFDKMTMEEVFNLLNSPLVDIYFKKREKAIKEFNKVLIPYLKGKNKNTH